MATAARDEQHAYVLIYRPHDTNSRAHNAIGTRTGSIAHAHDTGPVSIRCNYVTLALIAQFESQNLLLLLLCKQARVCVSLNPSTSELVTYHARQSAASVDAEATADVQNFLFAVSSRDTEDWFLGLS